MSKLKSFDIADEKVGLVKRAQSEKVPLDSGTVAGQQFELYGTVEEDSPGSWRGAVTLVFPGLSSTPAATAYNSGLSSEQEAVDWLHQKAREMKEEEESGREGG